MSGLFFAISRLLPYEYTHDIHSPKKPVVYLGSRYIDIGANTFRVTGYYFYAFCVFPVDPVLQIVGDHASIETYNQVKHELGLDLPIYMAIFHYVEALLQEEI